MVVSGLVSPDSPDGGTEDTAPDEATGPDEDTDVLEGVPGASSRPSPASTVHTTAAHARRPVVRSDHTRRLWAVERIMTAAPSAASRLRAGRREALVQGR